MHNLGRTYKLTLLDELVSGRGWSPWGATVAVEAGVADSV